MARNRDSFHQNLDNRVIIRVCIAIGPPNGDAKSICDFIQFICLDKPIHRKNNLVSNSSNYMNLSITVNPVNSKKHIPNQCEITL